MNTLWEGQIQVFHADGSCEVFSETCLRKWREQMVAKVNANTDVKVEIRPPRLRVVAND